MFSKKPVEIIPEEDTCIWSCVNEDCSGWIRENFSFDENPKCPFCSADMEHAQRMLPILSNKHMHSINYH